MAENNDRSTRLFALIPPLLLLFVAGVQIYLALTASLTPWKGGGFGMFSTNDGNANRYLRIFVKGPDRSEELLLRGDLEVPGAQLEMFPGVHQFRNLAKAILKDQESKGLQIDSVRIQVWRIEYEKTDLAPTTTLIREYEYPGMSR